MIVQEIAVMADLAAAVELLVPELQRRGRFRTAYRGATFCAAHPLHDAARGGGADAGATAWKVFWRVTARQTVPGVAAGALFAFMVSLDDDPISMWLSDAQVVPLPVPVVDGRPIG